MAGYYKTARFDTLEGVDRFQRELDSFGVWYNPSLLQTSEGLYGVRYDGAELEKAKAEYYGVDKEILQEDLFM